MALKRMSQLSVTVPRNVSIPATASICGERNGNASGLCGRSSFFLVQCLGGRKVNRFSEDMTCAPVFPNQKATIMTGVKGNFTADIVVVGSGMGGAFTALGLARSGLSILVLESGGLPDVAHAGLAQRALSRLTHRRIARKGRWPGMLRVQAGEGDGACVYPGALGHGVGGSGAIYGAALGRFRRSDFERDDCTGLAAGAWGNVLANDWPVRAAEMFSAYDEAEALLGVVGGRDPLEDDLAQPLPPADISPRDRDISELLRQGGAHPYRLPVGIDYEFLRRGASELEGRRNGWNSGLELAVQQGRLTLRTDVHVTAITRITGGLSLHLVGGGTIEARQVVLAAGALNTPRILMASPDLFGGPLPDMLGRGLMFHKSDFFYTRACGDQSTSGPRKSIALRDGYVLPSGRPGGEVQSLPIRLGTELISEILGRDGAGTRTGAAIRLLRRLPGQIRDTGVDIGRLTLFATILEDMPYTGNRVLASDGRQAGDIGIIYHESDELRDRQTELRHVIRTMFGEAGSGFLSIGEKQMNWGHPCGTCRMGLDPASSVTDADGRLHGMEDIRIADASTFASSAGTNPGLTVVAQALRVASALRADLAN